VFLNDKCEGGDTPCLEGMEQVLHLGEDKGAGAWASRSRQGQEARASARSADTKCRTRQACPV